MRHPGEGRLRAFHDGALSQRECRALQQHLDVCPRCAQVAATIQARAARVRTLLADPDPRSMRVTWSARVARRRFEDYVARKKESAMLGKIFARRYRPAWAAATLVLILAVALSFAPVRTWAGSVLALFRVQRIEFIDIDPANLPDEETLEAAAGALETMMQDQVHIDKGGEPQQVDEATARSLPDISARFPSALQGEPRVTLRPSWQVTMQVDLQRVRTLLSELGYRDIDLPKSLDGAEIQVDFATTVLAEYGQCASGSDEGQSAAPADCTILVQMPSPDVSAPAELDLDQLGQAYLQLLGLSPEEAARFSERVDWTSTLVVPSPRSMNLDYQDVTVDGVAGTLVRPPRRRGQPNAYTLMWVKGGVVYALSGSGTTQDAVRIAGSLQ